MQVLRQSARMLVRTSALARSARSVTTIRSVLPTTTALWNNTSNAKFNSRSYMSGSASQNLQNELQKEIDYENNNNEDEDLTDEIRESGFSVKETLGDSNIELEKLYDDEKITVRMKVELLALPDEDETTDPEAPPPNPGIFYTVIVTKNNKKGAIFFDMSAVDGEASVENIFYNPDTTTALALDPESEYKNHNAYPGPNLAEVEEALEIAFGEYLLARGINDDFALLAEKIYREKEQKEYMNWLSEIKNFIS
eukprot:CFRG2284T1